MTEVSPRNSTAFMKSSIPLYAPLCVDTVIDERVKWHANRWEVLLVTLDIRNAFNLARWDDMLQSLERNFRIPRYLDKVLKHYLRDQKLLFKMLEGRKEKALSAGIAQGLVLGPDPWTAFYDGLLQVYL